MADIDKILSKIEKLLRLSKSDNVNEAASAAAHAQDLMDRYQISMCDVENVEEQSKDPIEDRGVVHNMGGRHIPWVLDLVRMLAKNNHCKIYLTYSRTKDGRFTKKKQQQIAIVGRKGDFQTVSYMKDYLTREIKRLCNRECYGLDQRFRNDYRAGCVEEIGEILKLSRDELKRSMESVVSSTALVRFDNRIKDVRSWMDNNMSLVPGRQRRSRSTDGTAKAMGAMAAHSINLSAGKGAIAASKKRVS